MLSSDIYRIAEIYSFDFVTFQIHSSINLQINCFGVAYSLKFSELVMFIVMNPFINVIWQKPKFKPVVLIRSAMQINKVM